MDSLPPEILLEISSFLAPAAFFALACVSRAWAQLLQRAPQRADRLFQFRVYKIRKILKFLGSILDKPAPTVYSVAELPQHVAISLRSELAYHVTLYVDHFAYVRERTYEEHFFHRDRGYVLQHIRYANGVVRENMYRIHYRFDDAPTIEVFHSQDIQRPRLLSPFPVLLLDLRLPVLSRLWCLPRKSRPFSKIDIAYFLQKFFLSVLKCEIRQNIFVIPLRKKEHVSIICLKPFPDDIPSSVCRFLSALGYSFTTSSSSGRRNEIVIAPKPESSA